MKGFYIQVKNGLLDPRHVHAMHGDRNSGCIWLFLWLLDKMTIVDYEKGEGKVLGGKPIKYVEIKKDLGFSRRTYAEYIKILRSGNYIKTTQTPYGLVIIVYKAFKVFGQKPKRDVQRSAHLIQRTAHITPPYPRTSNKTIQLRDNTEDEDFSLKKDRRGLDRLSDSEFLKKLKEKVEPKI